MAVLVCAGTAGANPRTWTDIQGRQIEATLIGVSGALATVILADGTMFDLPADRLSEEDLAFVREWVADNAGTIGTLPLPSTDWPPRIRVPPPSVEIVEEGGKVNIYRTEHFEFRCSARLSRDLVRRFGTVFEATYAAVAALPIGLAPVPQRDSHWVVLLYPDRSDFIEAGGHPDYGAQYSRSTGHVMVPLPRLGVRRTSSGFSYSSDTDPSTLIHEVTHQLTHAWLMAGLPAWLSEGIACYMESLPYSNGTFHFRQHNIRDYLRESRARQFGPPWPLTSVEGLLDLPRQEWNETISDNLDQARINYYSATLLFYHFLHHDGEGDSGRLIRYLQALRAGIPPEHRNGILLGERTYEELQREVIRSFGRRGIRLTPGEL